MEMDRSGMTLYSRDGQRKYLNQKERLRFFECTKTCKTDVKLFCQLLYYTGARISEIHNLSIENIDFENDTVVIETLKKRHKGIFREIPLPYHLLEDLRLYTNNLDNPITNARLWKFTIRTASRHVKRVMQKTEITGVRSCARGLRHGFAVNAANQAPISLIRKWLGHSSLETTAIYLDIIGTEERNIAEKIW